MDLLELRIDYTEKINYLLVHNKMKVIYNVEVTNTSGAPLLVEQIDCECEYFKDCSVKVMLTLAEGETVRLGEDFNPTPDFAKMMMLTDGMASSFDVVAWANVDGERTQAFRQTYSIALLTYDYWIGMNNMPRILASFCTPNHPAVEQIITKAAPILKELSGLSQFSGYQSDDVNVVLYQVAALYAALQAEGIVYRPLPPSYEQTGQRVALPCNVLSSKIGNCIELTMLLASALEAVGINSVVVLQSGHAFLGVWLVDSSCSYCECDDVSYISKRIADGIGEMTVVDAVAISSDGITFDGAVKSAEREIANVDKFKMFIDVHRCRINGVLPLPQIVDGKLCQNSEGVDHETSLPQVVERNRFDLSKIDDKGDVNKIDIWERKLLDFSLRNNMLNMYFRKKAVQIISFEINKLEDNLQDGAEYVIECKPEEMTVIDDGQRMLQSPMYSQYSNIVLDDMAHKVLHTFKPEGESRAVLKSIYREARCMMEENGANSLFLAIGTLRWYENDKSSQPHYAPIMMLPVDIVYKRGKYYIRTRDEEMIMNITLTEFLRQNYEIKVPYTTNLPADEHGVDVPLVLAAVRESIKGQPRWDVLDEAVLGVFSFNKFLMWNDVHSHREQLVENDVISSLVQQRLTWQPQEMISNLKGKDKEIRPQDLALPVPIDSSQLSAVIEAGLGHSFILYGPPGTGKSQTITNMIANALFQGKRVLFVAEKMAALSVVQKRLEKVGLGPFCLEMHSNKVTKRHVLEQLKMALNVHHIVSPEEYTLTATKLYDERSKLIGYLEAVHEKDGIDDFSLYDCIVRYEAIDATALQCDVLTPQLRKKLTGVAVTDYEHLLSTELKAVLMLVDQPSEHQLKGLNIDDDQMANLSELKDKMLKTKQVIDDCRTDYAELSRAKRLRKTLLKDNKEELLSEDAEALRNEWRSINVKWFLPRYFAKKSFLKRMRAYNQFLSEAEVGNLLEMYCDYSQKHSRIDGLQQCLQQFFDVNLGCDCMPTTDELATMLSQLTRWSNNLDKARDWYHWCNYRKRMRELALDRLVEYVENHSIDKDLLCKMFFKAFYSSLAKLKISENAALRTFEGVIFDTVVEKYRELSEQFRLLSQKELYARLAARVPRVTENIDSSSEIGFLNRNISNGGRGVSLRDLMSQIPTLLPRLCPCMLMSPMSVAQYIDLSNDKFDVVIFDEASQMPTSESVGAIARGKSLIVVGDPKQMPPTSFFTTSSVGDEEVAIDDMESILEDCRTLNIPSLQLNWHYRSRHESLISFSNNEYYDGRLITFPSVDDRDVKVRLVRIKGVYDKGGHRSNRDEAQAIVNEVVRRIKDEDLRRHSIGVIAFSVAQQNLIEDLLQEQLDTDAALHEAADAMYEPLFIKNLENVQGDERDVILFSIGYGPDKNGKVSMNFGPLNNSGGERRLNVAVSRSREEMIVYSSLKSSDIDMRRSKSKGVEGLKHFLEYVESQQLVYSANRSDASGDVAIARQIAKALKERGYNVADNVGRSQFKVDVAVCDTDKGNRYVLGLLIDGEGYSNTQTTRDREIVQPEVLRGLGWRVMRVWSVDWINNRERVLKRIEQEIENAMQQAQDAPVEDTKPEVFDISGEEEEEQHSMLQDYNETQIPVNEVIGLSEVELSRRIIQNEQPITMQLLCKRVSRLCGMPRVTTSLQNQLMVKVKKHFYIQPDRNSYVVWENAAAATDYCYYRLTNGRDINEIPICEIANAVIEAVQEQLTVSRSFIVLVVARKLGFTRRGTKVEEAVNTAINYLVGQNKVKEVDNNITLP
ncbi:MAG: DUF4011 domain-containing protein [Muribaculaceae bacterium]